MIIFTPTRLKWILVRISYLRDDGKILSKRKAVKNLETDVFTCQKINKKKEKTLDILERIVCVMM